MAKRLTAKEKKEIIESFTEGKSIEFLLKKFNCTKLTIIRNLKKYLGEKTYKELKNKFNKKLAAVLQKEIVYCKSSIVTSTIPCPRIPPVTQETLTSNLILHTSSNAIPC